MSSLLVSPVPGIADVEFSRIRELVKRLTGISLSDQKKSLVVSRLGGRLRSRNAATFTEYLALLQDPKEGDELQAAIDLITTNETSFFREADHFKFLETHIRSLRPVPFPFRVWSAASSSGEEAYTIAMVLADLLGAAEWSVHGTDISTRVLERARRAIYPLERSATIPQGLLHAHCLKGQGKYEGMFLIDKHLRQRVSFSQANLIGTLPRLGPFDVAFLRNVLIYFDSAQRKTVVDGVTANLKPGGLLIVGHSESLSGLHHDLTPIRPTVYRVA